MDISVYVASAFSKNNKGGNKAGVVLNEPTLATAQKMAIAKQLGYAETAFLTESNHADFKLEYFTPKEEVDLCGHATIGTFAILMHLNKIHKSRYTIETNSGVLTITIKDGTIFMEQNQPTFYDIIPPNNLTDCFDLNLLNANYPIQIVSTGLKDILIPIKSEAGLFALAPNFEEVKEVSKQYEVVGMHLYTFSDDRIICRNFAPLFDINEEAATGTSNAALACYLYKNHYLRKELYVFEQGHSLHSPSEILVKLDVNGNKEIARVYVGGNGYYSETKYLSME
ncbi:PhzF family phenazine biosynthesis protein [Listeria cossartiae subsp. cayugensis]|uniref:PhzF family phenazine biosynthesis protein n=1 Tax=Listeria cossartiae TaxID=2838249 RepID=UPI00288063F3|nr:PhzF family phenazine biosynthesis protein [Listeria cossartiae]MDT0001466.1 PhzF family phenazine biosynthesis protein [Listeria cossartiae subsp. cayugensis]MDT0009312.1 PhzF family phenazine biosynthesis protein [Listeria cossartiae subsp. cayugensis]MDT0031496.1 PhzF family phenazine biosynthesis protein [Listeria cossartiae subsp. cayugensis]MDT0039612.1 PhzF family phenazine biosynthesis protein [Listeria cossartiae subsp. cayugensis]MDT0044609.1 PhzF family phenazine biosynthesis pro